MTLEQKRQEIRKKINEACPELLKLEFGCELLVKFIDGKLDINTIVKKSGKDCIAISSKGYFTTYYDLQHSNDILGKPPTLEHLLRTIKIKEDLPKNFKNNFIFADGSIGEIFDSMEYYVKDFSYNLTKPPLEQSEEVINFIYQLICE